MHNTTRLKKFSNVQFDFTTRRKMKSILGLLFFLKFSFAYRLYNSDGFNITLPDLHRSLCIFCKFDCDLRPQDVNDEDLLHCHDIFSYPLLYCEPPKILDENKECVSEISSEKWQEIFQNSTKSWQDFIYFNNVDLKKFGKVKGKKVTGYGYGYNFAAIGKSPEGEYKMLNFGLLTCKQEVEGRNWDDGVNEDGGLDLFSMAKISMTQLISIIFFLLLLISYLTIAELRQTVHGQCWINFLIISLINYLAAIFQLIYIKDTGIDKDFYVMIHTITHLKPERTNFIELFTFQVSSTIIIFTEFSLYFWLNITFFEAFYTIR
jgi:hypothetical protein